ncbi:hypothetical protein M5K25_006675 [Dendrobium thyrsiflorum]|uniref:Uncharacterized protein n=1 Tax=Dendrobium thyrsiflorum TaxID=117978 RepID=A0ABD0VD82_DENTH
MDRSRSYASRQTACGANAGQRRVTRKSQHAGKESGWPRDRRRGLKLAMGGGHTAQAHAGGGLVCRKVSRTSDRQKTSKVGRIGNQLQSVLGEVLCLHRGVVKKEEGVLCHHRGEVKKEVLRFSAGERKKGSLPSPWRGEKGRVAVLCRRKEEGFSAIIV